MTIVTSDGKLVAASPGDVRHPADGGPAIGGARHAGLLPLPGQQIRVIDVADSVAKLTDPDEFASQLSAELTRRGLI